MINSLDNTLSGMDALNPAANPGQLNIDPNDPAVRMMQQLADQLATPQPTPPVATPTQQFLSLLAANAGSQLLRQPSAAQPAIEAVQAEQAKPDKYRLEQQKRLDESRMLRLQSMIRASDNAIKVAEAQQEWNKVITLQKNAHAWEAELEGLRNRAKLSEIAATGTEERKTEAMKIAGQRALLNEKINQTASAYGLTKNQVSELNNYGDMLDKILGGGYVGSVTYGGGAFNEQDAARIANMQSQLLDRKAREIKARDAGTPPPPPVVNPYQSAYDKYAGKK